MCLYCIMVAHSCGVCSILGCLKRTTRMFQDGRRVPYMEGGNIVIISFSGITEYSDRKVIILTRYSIPCLPLSNTVVVCYGRVHSRIQSWIPGSVLFRVTVHRNDAACRCHRNAADRRHGKYSEASLDGSLLSQQLMRALDDRYTGRGPEIHQIHCVSALLPDTLDTQVHM
jgi:hypothetical protein